MSTDRYAGYLGDGLHLFDAADAHFRDPESAADVGPLLTRLGGLHSSTFVGAELALGLDAQGAGATEPGSGWDVGDAVAGLMDAYVALVAEHHLIAFLRVGLEELKKNYNRQCNMYIKKVEKKAFDLGV